MKERTLVRRTRKMRSVAGAIQAFRRTTAGDLVDRLAPYIEEGEDLGEALDLVHRVLRRMIVSQSDELGSAHGRHRVQQAVIQSPRQRRDRAAADLRSVLVSVREAAVIEFGRVEAPRLLGIKGRTAHLRQVDQLIFQTNAVLAGLQRAISNLPASRPRTVPSTGRDRFRSGEWIEALREPLTRVEAAQEEVILRQNEMTSAGGDEHDAAGAQDAVLSAVKKVVEGFHELSGKDTLQVRPLFPRKRKRRKAARPAVATALRVFVSGGREAE